MAARASRVASLFTSVRGASRAARAVNQTAGGEILLSSLNLSIHMFSFSCCCFFLGLLDLAFLAFSPSFQSLEMFLLTARQKQGIDKKTNLDPHSVSSVRHSPTNFYCECIILTVFFFFSDLTRKTKKVCLSFHLFSSADGHESKFHAV